MKNMKVKLYRSPNDSLWYFAIVSRNGKNVAASEGYKRAGSAMKTLRSIFSSSVELLTQVDALALKHTSK